MTRSAALLVALCLLPRCAAPSAHDASLDWTLGTWTGFRRAAADGTAAPMTLRVEAIPGREGYVECLRVDGPRGPYTGFATRTKSGESGEWVMVYTNSPQRTFARLRADGASSSTSWESTTAAPGRGSRLVWERLGPDGWLRTQLVSEDGGASWKTLFVDELERAE